jgi:TusA-related sulfurtransferase
MVGVIYLFYMRLNMVGVNVRGYSRRIPTIRTQKAMRGHPGEPLQVLVDTRWAEDDITRLGVNKGYAVKCQRTEAG